MRKCDESQRNGPEHVCAVICITDKFPIYPAFLFTDVMQHDSHKRNLTPHNYMFMHIKKP